MPKLNRSYSKRAPYRDARLFVIIAEGIREENYFKWFNAKNSRIQVLIIEQEDNRSAPRLLIERLHAAEKEGKYVPNANDHVWFVCDVDRWRAQIEELRVDCQQNVNWNVAVSNPCFEVWLHFHSGPLDLKGRLSCQMLKRRLPNSRVGAYETERYGSVIEEAALNARNSDPTPDSFFPDYLQSKIYKLAESMLAVLGNNWK
jgi:hypothetical protein